jgi:branched-chain amino acid transport system permease protein
VSDLFLSALASGVMLGGFYAAVTLGLTLAFGYLNVVNIAHPAFVLLGSYAAYGLNARWGLDPVLVGAGLAPVFFVLGVAVYSVYHASFEAREDESLRGLAFFFGLMFLIEVALILTYGVDYRLVTAPYIGPTIEIAAIQLPTRMLVPFAVALVMVGGLHQFLAQSYTGRAIRAVAQDQQALRLVAADPVRIKRLAFGLAIATACMAGALLVVIGPVEPSMGRQFIGRVFAIVVLGGMGSTGGTLLAALILGLAESLTSTYYGPSWAPAVAFGFLLAALAIRPAGLLGR